MKLKIKLPPYQRITAAILLTIFMVLLTTTISSAMDAAQANPPYDDDPYALVRDHMMQIAEAYKNYKWVAVNDAPTDPNNEHPPIHNDSHKDGIYTPDKVWCDSLVDANLIYDDWGCWKFANHVNVGIPYFWGGRSALRDDPEGRNHGISDLNILPVDGKTVGGNSDRDYFDKRIAIGLFAGDVRENSGSPHQGSGAGVDCSGFVMAAWQVAARFTPAMVRTQLSRPILFQDLRPGDIISADDHMILFKEWTDPLAGIHTGAYSGTAFLAYEAAESANRVVLSEYRLMDLGAPIDKPWGGNPDIPDSPFIGTSKTNIIKIRREYSCSEAEDDCLGTNYTGWPGTGMEYTMDQNAFPSTFFTPVDIVLVIDRSGSMDGVPLIQAKKSAEMFVDQMFVGDKISIVAFDNTASFVYPQGPEESSQFQVNGGWTGTLLQTIRSQADKDAAKAAIEGIQAGGGTSIGAGLDHGRIALEQFGVNLVSLTPDPIRNIILLSDGAQNAAPLYDSNPYSPINKPLLADKIAVYTVGIGDADDSLMSHIATDHNGKYVRAASGEQLQDVYQAIYGQIYHHPMIQSSSGVIPQGGGMQPLGATNQTITVDSAMGMMNVSLMWNGSVLDLTLEQPDGSLIDPIVAQTDPNIDFMSSSNYAMYTIRGPQLGQWNLHISGAAGQSYTTSVSALDAMTFSVNTDKTDYLMGETIKLTASIDDNDSPDLIASSPNYIHAATIVAQITDPASVVSTVTLYDDGTHGDDVANDGIYKTDFTGTALPGVYDVDIKASGQTNRDGGLPFTREDKRSIVVALIPKVTSITRADSNPTNSYIVNFMVNFSEPVTGVDASDFSLITSELTGATISAVNPSNHDARQYIVSVDTGPITTSATLRLDLVDDDTITDEDDIPLGTLGAGNGDFTNGETYDILGHENEIIVTRSTDMNDGVCDSDCSLPEAIATAPTGATISFAPALSGDAIYLTIPLVPLRSMTIDGSALAIPIEIRGDKFYSDPFFYTQSFRVNSGVTLTLKGLNITKTNSAANSGTLILINSTLSDNYSRSLGGAIYNNHGTLIVNGTTFSNNRAQSGGAIYNDHGTVTITDSNFIKNYTTDNNGGGGAIENYVGTLTVTRSTFSNNTADGGGGIDNNGLTTNNSPVTITNSTFAGNIARFGGGIRNSTGIATIMNSTFSDNKATLSSGSGGGGIYNTDLLHYANTIIANSITGGDCVNSGGVIGTNTNNLVEDGSCSAGLSGDPNLGPLADNGGLTQTMILLSGSSAINTGDNASCAASSVNNVDQRGVVRPQGSFCDIGAFEKYAGPIPSVDVFAVAPYTDSFDIPVTRFLTSDDIGVTGYMITQTGIAPSSGGDTWLDTLPETYHVTEYATYTLYAWVKDADGNVSPVLNTPSTVIVTPVIAFNISGNTGVDGATLSYTDDNGAHNSTSASDGSYSITVTYNWSGTVSISKLGYSFAPSSRSYSNLLTNISYQNYIPTQHTPTVTMTSTITETPTLTSTATSTSTVTVTPTPTSTITLTSTPTSPNTNTPTRTATFTPTITKTFTPTKTITKTPTITPTITKTPTSVTFTSVGLEDGWTLESVQGAGLGSSFNDTATIFNVGDDAANRQYRGILSFDTSSLPANANILSVVVKVRTYAIVGTNPFSAIGDLKVDVKNGTFGTYALEFQDFERAATDTGVGIFSDIPSAGWYTATLGSPAYNDINLAGLTQIRLRFVPATNANNEAEYLKFYSGDDSTSSNWPKLIITYTH